MNKLVIGLITLFLLSSVAFAGATGGQVTNIQGQRVTIMTESGEQVTVTSDNEALKVGDNVSVDFEEVGDAMMATKVSIIAQ